MTTAQPERHVSARAWLVIVLTAVAVALLFLPVILAVSERSDSAEQAGSPAPPSDPTEQSEPPPAPPSGVVDEATLQRCAATDLVDVVVSMQPAEQGANGTRTLGTVTITTASTEQLMVWVLVDEGEIGETNWSTRGWQLNGGPLGSGGSIVERVSQTGYVDGDSTWRIINGIAAWRTGPDCADLPTNAQLDEIAAPL